MLNRRIVRIFYMYFIQLCFICRPEDSSVLEDAGIEPRTIETLVLEVRRSNHLARSYPQGQISSTTRLDLIHKARYHPQLGQISSPRLDIIRSSAGSHPQGQISATTQLDLIHKLNQISFTTRLDLIHKARSHPQLDWISSTRPDLIHHSSGSHPEGQISSTARLDLIHKARSHSQLGWISFKTWLDLIHRLDFIYVTLIYKRKIRDLRK